jgi:type I restriction enzyme R subunit
MIDNKEAKSRLKIDKLLEKAGWRLLDNGDKKSNVDVEPCIKKHGRLYLGDDFEHTKNGFIDYLLLDDSQKPVAVLEAKRESIQPLSAKEQARDYANSIHARYVILSNGNTHYLWDMKFGNPEPISAFPTLESLTEDTQWQPDINALVSEPIATNYIALSQKPDFEQDPDYVNEATRKSYIDSNKLKILRNYQVNAIRSIQSAEQKIITANKSLINLMTTKINQTLTEVWNG